MQWLKSIMTWFRENFSSNTYYEKELVGRVPVYDVNKEELFRKIIEILRYTQTKLKDDRLFLKKELSEDICMEDIDKYILAYSLEMDYKLEYEFMVNLLTATRPVELIASIPKEVVNSNKWKELCYEHSLKKKEFDGNYAGVDIERMFSRPGCGLSDAFESILR